MIILDEHLKGIGLETAVSRWYRGRVIFVDHLRRITVIKDEAIPSLLRGVKHPTFVTMNYTDFWRRVQADTSYCIVCARFGIELAGDLSVWLRGLFALPPFKSKDRRMGSVVLFDRRRLQYYRAEEREVHLLSWPPGVKPRQ